MSFKLQHLELVPQTENAFAEYGILCHDLLDEWANGALSAADLANAYKERYNVAVTQPFPPFPRDMPQKYYDAGLNYFASFAGFGDKNEIMSAEEKFQLRIGAHLFAGIADLILRNRDTGAITIIDHKSKSMASMKKDMGTFRKQLYTYAAHVKDKYGEFPAMLRFNMFRDDVFLDEPFSAQAYDDTMQWIADTIDLILLEDDWLVSSSPYFCQYVCGVRHHCPVGEDIIFGTKR